MDDADDRTLDLRVSDAEREAVADLLRDQTTAGRLTLSEFEARLDEVFAAQNGRQLQAALRELPVTAPTIGGGAAPTATGDGVTHDELRSRYHRRLRGELSGFVVPNFICNLIWVLGDAGYWWPGWVLLGTGAGIIGTVVRGFDPDKERARYLAERRAQQMTEIEARHRPIASD
jgi:hypothetical protein